MELRIGHHSFPYVKSPKISKSTFVLVTLENVEFVHNSHRNKFTNTQISEIVQYIRPIDNWSAVQNRIFSKSKCRK